MENVREVVSGWVQEAKKNAGWLVALGVLTVIAGCLAIASPLLTGLTVVVLIGIALAIGGVARTIAAFSAGSFGQGTLAFIGGILTFGAGLILAARPGIGLATLTLILGAYLRASGGRMGVHALQRCYGRDPGILPAPGVAAVRGVGHRHDGGSESPGERVLHDLGGLRRASASQADVVDGGS